MANLNNFKPQLPQDPVDGEEMDHDLPPVVSDSDGMADETPMAAPIGADEDPVETPPEEVESSDPRARIAKKAAERRASEMESDLEEQHGVPSGAYGQPEGDYPRIEEQAPEEEEAAPAAEQGSQAPEGQPRYHELKVNGRTLRMTEDELIEEAQKNIAAGDKLELAKAFTTELAQARNGTENQRSEPEPEPEDTGEADTEENQLSEEELLDLVDTIQTGDQADAAQALKKVMSFGKQPTQQVETPVDLDAKIETALAEREARDEQETFLQGWASNNQDLVGDPELSLMVVNRVADAITTDLINLGYDRAEITQLRNASPEELGRFHREIRKMPQFKDRLGDPAKMMDDAAGGVRKRFNMPTPQRTDPTTPAPAVPRQTRQERKQALPQQPRSASVAAARSQPQNVPPRSRKEVVADMRRARGQKAS